MKSEPLIKKMPSIFTKKVAAKLPMTMILSYMAHLEDIKQLLRLLSKSTNYFLDQNLKQIWHFATDRPLERFTLAFGYSNQYLIKPYSKQRIEFLEVAYIEDDLWKIEEFVTGSIGFDTFQIGNRNFKLF